MISVLTPVPWYAAGRVPDGWSLFLFGLSITLAVAAVLLGWRCRSGPSGSGASFASLMAAVWLIITATTVVSVTSGYCAPFVTASNGVNSKLESMGNAVAGFDAAVLVGMFTTGASGLAGLAVFVPILREEALVSS